MNRRFLFRINAGFSYGYGHLTRCMNLVDEFDIDDDVCFLIKSDDQVRVSNYIDSIKDNKQNYSVTFLPQEKKPEDELIALIDKVKALRAFLVLDHYDITTEYQLALKSAKVRWLQFDSHGNGPFYSDILLHASPAATEKLYLPLIKNKASLLLLGTRYAVVNKAFRIAKNYAVCRNSLSHIFVSFGGGTNNGTLVKFLTLFDTNFLKQVSVDILIGMNNPECTEIQEFIAKHRNMHLYIGKSNIIPFMTKADIAIISPGTLSYEAACLGLPMLTIPFADNQLMNAEGWSNLQCAINLGLAESLNSQSLNGTISKLLEEPQHIANMSKKCFNAVDGNGPKRVRQAIESIL